MSLTYNKKVPVFFTKEEHILDGQSKVCNWLYNQLLAACQQDYKENSNALKLLEGRNLRNYGVSRSNIKQFRKKKRSLHEATARKGRKEKNTQSKRNEKNTKSVGSWHLNDKVRVFGQVGWISGFSGQTCYVKSIQGDYITVLGKTYKQVNLNNLELICHNNNWQFSVL